MQTWKKRHRIQKKTKNFFFFAHKHCLPVLIFQSVLIFFSLPVFFISASFRTFFCSTPPKKRKVFFFFPIFLWVFFQHRVATDYTYKHTLSETHTYIKVFITSPYIDRCIGCVGRKKIGKKMKILTRLTRSKVETVNYGEMNEIYFFLWCCSTSTKRNSNFPRVTNTY